VSVYYTTSDSTTPRLSLQDGEDFLGLLYFDIRQIRLKDGHQEIELSHNHFDVFLRGHLLRTLYTQLQDEQVVEIPIHLLPEGVKPNQTIVTDILIVPKEIEKTELV
jgi:hypothetical protein